MRYFKLDLLTLLISLFIFSSCEKDGTIGLDIGAQDSIRSTFTDTATVHAVTVEEDSVNTSGLTQNPFGRIVDPIFGITEANLALGLNLPSDNFEFGPNPLLDSAVLVLKYGDEFYGDSLNSKYVINVHRLSSATPLNLFKSYNSKSIFQNEATTIGGENVQDVRSFKWRDSATVTSIIRGAADKAIKVVPQLRIKLSPAFIQTYFFGANANSLKSSTAFSNFFKGVYITLNKNQSTGTGGLIFFDLKSDVSALEIFYKTRTTSLVISDTVLTRFKVVGASEIRRDRSNTFVQAQLSLTPQAKTYDTVYVQPLAGVRTRLRFPHIKRLAAQGSIGINKAELVIPVALGVDPLRPAPRLTLYRTDIAGQRTPIVDNTIFGEQLFGGLYNATSKTYTFNVTSYIQELISKSVNYEIDTYIAPINPALTNQANLFPVANTAARSILGGTGQIKLKITYTKPN